MKQLLAIIICVICSATVLADSAFVYVTGKTVNLRQEPNTSGKILGTANLGDIYPVNDMDGRLCNSGRLDSDRDIRSGCRGAIQPVPVYQQKLRKNPQ